MRIVHASQVLEGTVHEAEAVWYDLARWPRWVPGLETVSVVGGQWPSAGAQVRWESGPAGRGRVLERVVEYEPLAGQTVEVEDDSIRGHQTVAFSAQEANVAVELSLAYELKQRSPLMRLVDVVFIRRAMTRALEQTLGRFGSELEAARASDVG